MSDTEDDGVFINKPRRREDYMALLNGDSEGVYVEMVNPGDRFLEADEVESVGELLMQLRQLTSPYGIFPVPERALNFKPIEEVPWQAGDANPVCCIYTILSPMLFDGEPICRSVIIWPEEVGNQVIGMLGGSSNSLLRVPGGREVMMLADSLFEAKPANMEFSSMPVCYYCNQTQLIELVMKPQLSASEKILSTLCSLYTPVRDNLRQLVNILPYSAAVSLHKLRPEGVAVTNKVDSDQEFRIITSIITLIPAFTRADRITEQLYARYKAACITSVSLLSDQMAYTQVFNRLNMQPGDMPGVVFAALGFLLSRDKTGAYVANCKLKDLMSEGEHTAKYNLTPWRAGLLGQMFLVYQRHHQATLQFALAVRRVVVDQGCKLPAKFQEEETALETAQEYVEGAPFAGLQKSQPDIMHVAKFPRYSYLGLLYNGLSLVGTEEEQWKKFAIGSVAAHVGQKHDQGQVELVLTMIPPPSITLFAELAKSGAADGLEVALGNAGPRMRDQLYAFLHKTDPTCEWYLNDRARRTRLQQEEYASAIHERLEKEWTIKKNSFLSSLMHEHDPIRVNQITTAVLTREAEIQNAFRELVPSSTLIRPPAYPGLEDIRADYEDRYKAIALMISSLAIR